VAGVGALRLTRGRADIVGQADAPAPLPTEELRASTVPRDLRERGVVLNGCAGPSRTLLRRGYGPFHRRCRATVRGTARLLWGWNGVLGPDRHGSDATLHPLARTHCRMLEWRWEGWSVIEVDATGVEHPVASGRWPRAVAGREVGMGGTRSGLVRRGGEAAQVWGGDLARGTGVAGAGTRDEFVTTAVKTGRFSRRLQLAPGPVPQTSWSLSPCIGPEIYWRAESFRSPGVEAIYPMPPGSARNLAVCCGLRDPWASVLNRRHVLIRDGSQRR